MAGRSSFRKLRKAPPAARASASRPSLHSPPRRSGPVAFETSYIQRPEGGLEVYERAVEYALPRAGKRARVVSPEPSPEPFTEPHVDQAAADMHPSGDGDNASAWVDVEMGDEGSEEREHAEQEAEKNTKQKAPRKGKTISEKVEEWEARFPSILQDMLSWEVPEEPLQDGVDEQPDVEAPNKPPAESPWRCTCGKPALYRCLECHSSAPRCSSCMRTDHQNAWFHFIEAWKGQFFQRYDLISIGFVIYLGHNGRRCPHLSDHRTPSRITIGHSNGLHECNVQYCHCPGRPDHVSQLLRARLWPATLDNIKTAFSVSLLQLWHQLWLNAHVSNLHFMRILSRCTDNASPADVANPNRQFRLISRIYAHLTMVKRSGVFLNVVVPGRRPDDITLMCVFCPRIDFNMPSNWKEVTPKNKLHIYGPVYGGDGNMAASKRARKDDKKDKRLASGFWVDHPLLPQMLTASYGANPEASSDKEDQTCSGFKVGRAQRTGKFRFTEISGIVAITCRHVFFRSGAVLDLITGERYSFMDFALAGAMRGDEHLPEHRFSYDVLCIFIKGLLERWGVYFPELVPIIAKMFCCIPSFHIHSHRDLCQAVYGMCYAIGWGLLHMETVEHPWSKLNKAAAALREMTGGARHDAYNDLFNFWNREKLERMVDYLPKELEKAYKLQAQTTEQFANKIALAGSHNSRAWASMDIHTTAPTPSNWAEKVAAYDQNIYVLHRSEMPTREKALNELVKSFEDGDKQALDSVVAHLRKGAAHFIRRGIDLDMDKFVINSRSKLAKSGTKDVYPTPLAHARRAYKAELAVWRKEQKKFMPLLPLPDDDVAQGANEEDNSDDDEEDEEDNVDKEDEENHSSNRSKPDPEILALPSDFNAREIDMYGIKSLADYELKLRVGLAFDLLSEVREAVKHAAAHLAQKKKDATTKKDHLREQSEIKKSRTLGSLKADEYNHNYDRLKALRVLLKQPAAPGEMESKLQRIDEKKGDLRMISLVANRSAGDRKLLAEGSWIWSVFDPPNEKREQPDRKGKAKADSDEEAASVWSSKAECAHWHRARMEKTQVDTHVELLCADFRAGIRGFDCLFKCWTAAAERDDVSAGGRAYLYHKAEMYRRMRNELMAAYKTALKPGVDPEALDHHLPVRSYLEPLVRNILPYEEVLELLEMD